MFAIPTVVNKDLENIGILSRDKKLELEGKEDKDISSLICSNQAEDLYKGLVSLIASDLLEVRGALYL